MQNIYLAPVITERSLSRTENKEYTFVVPKSSTKFQIKTAIEEAFGVSVKALRTITIKGKTKRVGKQSLFYQTADKKLAIAKVSEKDKIDLFDTEEKKLKKGGKKSQK